MWALFSFEYVLIFYETMLARTSWRKWKQSKGILHGVSTLHLPPLPALLIQTCLLPQVKISDSPEARSSTWVLTIITICQPNEIA